jgi:hypothetical protein
VAKILAAHQPIVSLQQVRYEVDGSVYIVHNAREFQKLRRLQGIDLLEIANINSAFCKENLAARRERVPVELDRLHLAAEYSYEAMQHQTCGSQKHINVTE